MSRRHAGAAGRNAYALVEALRARLPRPAAVLELGSGTGEHAVWAARALPWATWQPSDPDPESRASIAAWTAHEGLANVLPPLHLDVLAAGWTLRRADAVVAVNVLHRAGPAALEALLAGAAKVLQAGGLLLVAGPFLRQAGRAAAAEALDAELRAAGGGLRVPALEDLLELARVHGLSPEPVQPLPDGTSLVVLRRS